MVNIPLVDRLGNFTGPTIDRGRLDNKPANLTEVLEFARPHAHSIIYSKSGLVLVQERPENKRFLGGKLLPIIGGHVYEEDKLEGEKRGRVYEAYRIGGARELGPGEEIGIKVDPSELRFVVKKHFREGEVEGLDYNLFVAIFDMIYDRKIHGPKIVNRREIVNLDFMTIKEIEEAGLFSVFGNMMGGHLLEHAKQTSFKIRYLGHEYVQREMRGEVPVLYVPQKVIDKVTKEEKSPEDIMKMLELKKNTETEGTTRQRRRPKRIGGINPQLKDSLNT